MEKSGLTSGEVLERKKAGQINTDSSVPTKTIPEIIRTNTLTFFNLLNFALFIAVLLTGSPKNGLFMGVVLCNIVIGTFQEIRAKRIIDKLSLIYNPKAHVIRDNMETEIPIEEVVLDDIIHLKTGMQIPADSVIISGECEVDESLLTGESDYVAKNVHDEILSGTHITSGEVYVKAIGVGENSFSSGITKGAKYLKKPNSKMFKAVDKLIKIIAVSILPLAAILFIKSIFIMHEPISSAVPSVAASIISMIPEGLVLLISVVLAVSTIRLSKHNLLVQDMYAIETLARVDVLCLDKTGTITVGKMGVEKVIPFGVDEEYVSNILGLLMRNLKDENPTANAVRDRFSDSKFQNEPVNVIPFSSQKKWSGVEFLGEIENHKTFILGAANFVLSEISPDMAAVIKKHSETGCRVLLLAASREGFKGKDLPNGILPLALIIIADIIRKEAPKTLKYFKNQNVAVKIISGDDALTVSAVAARAGVEGAKKYIDMSGVYDDEIPLLISKYNVFGRVSPSQKLALIKAFKAEGHTVAMTGDGVNDVLALKEADCSIAMQSGSEAARNVSSFVLLDSNFSSLPNIVSEGRRSINNVERSAKLFLTKTVFAFFLAIIYAIIFKPYPFMPIQMTLINALFIGAPSFLLTLEKNQKIIRGTFIQNVLRTAIPLGLNCVISLVIAAIFSHFLRFSTDETRVLSVYILGTCSAINLLFICVPFTRSKYIMAILLTGIFNLVTAHFRLQEVFYLTAKTAKSVPIMLIIMPASFLLAYFLPRLTDYIIMRYKNFKRKRETK